MVGGFARRPDHGLSSASVGPAGADGVARHRAEGSGRRADGAGWVVVARPYARPSASSRKHPDPWSGSLLGADAIARSSSGPSRSGPMAVPTVQLYHAAR